MTFNYYVCDWTLGHVKGIYMCVHDCIKIQQELYLVLLGFYF